MHRLVIALIGLVAAGTAGAQPADPLQSADCRQALAALEVAEDRLLAAPPGAAPANALAQHRQEAARACLGGPDQAGPPRSPHVPAAPSAGTPRIPIPAAPVAPGVPPPTSPPAALPQAPLTITTCDAAGCWTNDGSRLQRFGTELIGPRGVCTMQGVVLNCR